MGLGFAWFSEDRIRLDSGRLKPLRMREGGERWVQLYLVPADPDFTGPGTVAWLNLFANGWLWNAPSGAIPKFGRVIDGPPWKPLYR